MKWKVVCAQVEYRHCAGRAERFSLPDQMDCRILYWILPPTTKGECHISDRVTGSWWCYVWGETVPVIWPPIAYSHQARRENSSLEVLLSLLHEQKIIKVNHKAQIKHHYSQ